MSECNKQSANKSDLIKKLSGLYNGITHETNMEYTKECISEAMQEIMALRNQLDLLTLLFRRELLGDFTEEKE